MEKSGSGRLIAKRAAVLLVCAIAAISLSSAATPDGVGGAPSANPLLDEILALIIDDESFAAADLSLLFPADPLSPPPTQHYGPYASGSPDSGTCGNEWAEDTFDRHFTVFRKGGSLVVVQQFRRGSFITSPGLSPGSCEPGMTLGTVDGGVTGTMGGYFIIPIPDVFMQTSNDPSCVAGIPAAPCTTLGFMNSHFDCGYPVGCPVTIFAFHYTGPDQDLILHHWKNADAARGGNGGDIRSADISS